MSTSSIKRPFKDADDTRLATARRTLAVKPIRRWIPRPWIPFSYPSYTSTSTSPGVTVSAGGNDNDAESSRTVCTDHIYSILADLRTRGTGGFYAPLRETATSVVYLNGQRVTPETAGKILEDYMTANAGVTVSMGGR